jgi:hypothetical protein
MLSITLIERSTARAGFPHFCAIPRRIGMVRPRRLADWESDFTTPDELRIGVAGFGVGVVLVPLVVETRSAGASASVHEHLDAAGDEDVVAR